MMEGNSPIKVINEKAISLKEESEGILEEGDVSATSLVGKLP